MNIWAVGVAAHVALLLAASAAAADGFDECDALFDADPAGAAAAECYYKVGRRQGEHETAIHLLDERIGSHPRMPWLHFYRGIALMLVRPCDGASADSHAEAARLFAGRQDLDNEAWVRTSRAFLLVRCADFEGARDELAEAERAAQGSTDPLAGPRLELVWARLPIRSGGDLEASHQRLKASWQTLAQPAVDGLPGVWPLRRETLRALAQVSLDLGRFHETESWHHKRRDRALEAGDYRDVVAADYGLLFNQMTHEWLPSDGNRQKIEDGLRTLLPEAEAAPHQDVEARIWLHLGKMARGSEAEEYLERCTRLAEELAVGHLRRWCALARASHRLEDDPPVARELLAEVQAADDLGPDDPLALVDGWDDRLRVLWQTKPRDEALADIEQVLGAIESLRDSQTRMARSEILHVHANAYYWLSGRLLADAAGDDDLRRAFAVMERLRSQELREILFMGGGAATGPRITRPDDDLWDQVVTALGEGEAMLSFQLALWQDWSGRFAGGAWVMVTTREGSTVQRLEIDREPVDRVLIEPLVKMLIDDRGGRLLDSPDFLPSLVLLHEALLSPALDALPGGIERLVLVPDGILHLLPFAALRPAADAPRLGERYEISIEPSAALWLRWKRYAGVGTEPSALVFAAPETASSAAPGGGARGPDGAVLGALPYARREGRKVLRHLRGASRLLRGAEASEHFLKQADLAPYGLLHFATHAVADHQRPWRSGVLLARGDDAEDGWLRPDEIAQLELDGKAIILSTCDSAAGGWLRGEGVMSLARAFFKAGAHAVIGTLRQLPDDQGERFFDDFYRHLSRGLSLRQALAATQRQWIADNGPASTWGNVVVLGNGDLVPAPGGVERAVSPWLWAALGLGLLLAGWLAVGMRKKSIFD